jgi:sulfur-oxidizing protein SoxZ
MDGLSDLQPRLRVPAVARAGERVEIRAMVAHPMETGFRRDGEGARIPRAILTRLVCRYGGREVLRVDLQPAITANPYFSFQLRADVTAPVVVSWELDGRVVAETAAVLEVVP